METYIFRKNTHKSKLTINKSLAYGDHKQNLIFTETL